VVRVPSPLYEPALVRPDMRLPEAALRFRRENRLIDEKGLRQINVTAWLYRDRAGIEGVQVNPNTTIAELVAQFGPADTRDAEVGIHSEGRAAEFFRLRRDLTVLQIFTERTPCLKMCRPLLRNYYPNTPVFYYYDRARQGGRTVADGLAAVYGLGRV
jgi:hypothetical protein